MNNINVQIDQCYQQLLQVINQSQLPGYQVNTIQEETQEEE